MSGGILFFTLAVATLAVSWAAIFIRLADTDPLSIAFYRMLFSSLIFLLPAARGLIDSLRRLLSSERWLLAGSGLLLGLHFATWITSLKYTSISNSVILVATQPFFIALMERLVWKEHLPRRSVWGMTLAFVGMVVIARGDIEMGPDHLFGDMLALIGAFCAGGYLMFGRKLRQKLDNRHYVFPVHLIATLVMLVIVLLFGSPLTGFPPKTWFWLAALAIVATGLGHNLYNYLLRYLRAHLVAVTILGEPLGATIFAAIIFAEYPSMATVLGGLLILAGILTALIRSKSDRLAVETA